MNQQIHNFKMCVKLSIINATSKENYLNVYTITWKGMWFIKLIKEQKFYFVILNFIRWKIEVKYHPFHIVRSTFLESWLFKLKIITYIWLFLLVIVLVKYVSNFSTLSCNILFLLHWELNLALGDLLGVLNIIYNMISFFL